MAASEFSDCLSYKTRIKPHCFDTGDNFAKHYTLRYVVRSGQEMLLVGRNNFLEISPFDLIYVEQCKLQIRYRCRRRDPTTRAIIIVIVIWKYWCVKIDVYDGRVIALSVNCSLHCQRTRCIFVCSYGVYRT